MSDPRMSDPRTSEPRKSDPKLSELLVTLHNRAQKAQSEAQAIEDPSTRRAINELASAVRDITKHLKRTAAK